jgi:hypothetical protein
MCIVCILLDKEKITKAEARKALWEGIVTSKTEEESSHIRDLYATLEEEVLDD